MTNIDEIIGSFLEDLAKKMSGEKEIYTRENQFDAFKVKIRPLIGKSVPFFDNVNISDPLSVIATECSN